MGESAVAHSAARSQPGMHELWLWIAAWAGVALVIVAAVHYVRYLPGVYYFDWTGVIRAIGPVLPQTAWAAIRVWLFWAFAALVLAGFILRHDPSIEPGDAILAGSAMLWVMAYVVGDLLGPLGLMWSATVWVILAAGFPYLLLRRPIVPRLSLSTGQKLAFLSWALLSVSLLPLQLGSPLPPFMDVLNHPAAVQRIVTFHRYLPFDNDPYGVFGSHVQAPALELFYAVLALGAHCRMGSLAETAAMVPMAGFIIFTAYRLGRTLFGDTAGGIASLFLFFTVMFRREQGMRATAVVFALIGLGLALFLEVPRRPALLAMGAMILGTAVASHAIGGGLAMGVAAGGAVSWLLEGDLSGFAAGVICLAGATMAAIPEVLVAFEHPLPYPALPAIQIAGIAVIAAAAARLASRSPRTSRIGGTLDAASVLLLALLLLYRLWKENTIFREVASNLPMLSAFAAIGLIAAAVIGLAEDRGFNTRAVVVALLMAVALEFANDYLGPITASPVARHMLGDTMSKLSDYWIPYFLVFPAGLLFALIYERFPKPLVLFLLLAILIYPWRHYDNPQDYDSVEHSVSEQWGFNLARALNGYWIGTADGRWLTGRDGFAVVDILRAEVEAGRITPATHILHITDTTSAWGLLPTAIFTGIDEDPIDLHYDPNNIFEAGSRVHGPADLPAAMARNPEYIVEQGAAPPGLANPFRGYDTLFDRGEIRLYRRSIAH